VSGGYEPRFYEVMPVKAQQLQCLSTKETHLAVQVETFEGRCHSSPHRVHESYQSNAT